MQFIVDLYRFLILLILALVIIGGAWLGFTLAMNPAVPDALRATYAGAAIGGAALIVLTLGITATFISIHDRLVNVADSSRRIADALERGPAARSYGDPL